MATVATVVSGVPGVYIQERRAPSARTLPTGVPVFVGLLTASAPMPTDTPAGADSYGPVALHHKTEFLGGAAGYLGDAVNGFFDNGGDYCYVVAIKTDPASGAAAAARMTDALGLTAQLDDVDLVAIPDAHVLADSSGAVQDALVLQVQQKIIDHCASVG